MRSFRKNPFPPNDRSLEIPRGRDVVKVKISEAKYKAPDWNSGGKGGAKQKPSVGGGWGMGIFWNYTRVSHLPFVKSRMAFVSASTEACCN